MKRALVLSVFLGSLAWAGSPAVAQQYSLNSRLHGNYGSTTTATCNLKSGGVLVVTSQGINTFHGDGTGAVTQTNLVSIAGAFATTHTDTSTSTFTYTVNSDGTFTTTTDPGSVRGTVLSGPGAGVTYTIDQLPTITGAIGENAQTLTGTVLEPLVETVTQSTGSVSERICHRSRVSLKLVGE